MIYFSTTSAQLASAALRKNLGLTSIPLSDAEIQSLDQLLLVHPQPRSEQLMRLVFEATVAKLPLAVRYPVTTLLKKFRNPRQTVSLLPQDQLLGYQLIAKILRSATPRFFYGNYQGAICLTHDIDNAIGYNMLPHVAELNRMHDIPATFNFLTRADYVPEKAMLEQLRSAGNEIGLHGLTHDIALAFRSKAAMTSFLQKGKEDLDGGTVGFRSPAYSISERLLAALGELGFDYDSSFQVTSQFYHSTTFPFPYQYPGLSLVELPVSLNDDIFFRDAKMADEQALEVTKALFEPVLAIGGVFVANIHPHNLVGRMEFYRKFLELLKQKAAQGVMLATAGKIVEMYRKV